MTLPGLSSTCSVELQPKVFAEDSPGNSALFSIIIEHVDDRPGNATCAGVHLGGG